MANGFFRCAAAVLTALLILSGAGAEAERAVLRTGSAAYLTEDGQVLTPAGALAELNPLGETRYAARETGGELYALLDERGEALTGFDYGSLKTREDVIVFGENGLFGAMDFDGNILIPARYASVVPLGDGAYLALKTDPLDDTPDRVEALPTGNDEPSGALVSCWTGEAGEGLCLAMGLRGLFGYLDGSGAWAIEPEYLWAEAFEDGAARVSTEAGMGLLSRDGSWLIEPTDARLLRKNDLILAVSDADKTVRLLGLDGTQRALFEEAGDAAFTGGGAAIRLSDGGFALTDENGNVYYRTGEDVLGVSALGGCVIERRAFSDGRAYRLIGADGVGVGDWQELSFAGECDGEVYCAVCDYEYEASTLNGFTFYDEAAGTRRYSLIDSRGNAVLENLTRLTSADDGLLLAETDEWIGLIRPCGDIVVKLDKQE